MLCVFLTPFFPLFLLLLSLFGAGRQVIQFFMDLFAGLEADGMDNDNDLHMYVLQYVFMSRIQDELDDFRQAWNNHAVTGEHGRTPNQLLVLRRHLTAAAIDIDDDFFGFDPEEDPDEVEDEQDAGGPGHHTVVNPRHWPLSDEALATFTANVLPLRREDDRGTLGDRYVQALEYANSLV